MYLDQTKSPQIITLRCVLGPGFGSVQKVSRERPRSVRDTFLTLLGHSWRHPVGHSLGHPPVFLGDTPGTLQARRTPQDSCSRPGGAQKVFVSLPALQKNFVNIFFVFAWEFCIEKWRGFLVNFFWSPSPTKQSTKNPRKIRGKFGAKFGAKFGTKFEKFGKLFVLQLF